MINQGDLVTIVNRQPIRCPHGDMIHNGKNARKLLFAQVQGLFVDTCGCTVAVLDSGADVHLSRLKKVPPIDEPSIMEVDLIA